MNVREARRGRRWPSWLAAIGVAVIGVGVVYQHVYSAAQPNEQTRGDGGKGRDRPLPVKAEAARSGELNVYLSGLGTVTPRHTVTVRTRVDGQLMRVAFEEGQMVEAGDLLAEIDPRPYQVQLLEAQGALARDQALLENAKVDLERYRTLYRQDSGSKQEWDTQKALVRQYEGAIKSDQAQIESAKLQLTYCRITAPISGRAGLRQLDPGNIARASDTSGLVVITELQPITVIFTLPASEASRILGQLDVGAKLPVDAYDGDMKTLLARGVLLTIDNQIDTSTGTVRLKAEFPNEDGWLFPNQFVTVRLLVETLKEATLVPNAAIQVGSQGTYVYLLDAERAAAARPVSLGAKEGDLVAVRQGLAPGDLVVVDGADKLRTGSRVTLIDGPAPTDAAPAATPSPSGEPGQIRAQRRHRPDQ